MPHKTKLEKQSWAEGWNALRGKLRWVPKREEVKRQTSEFIMIGVDLRKLTAVSCSSNDSPINSNNCLVTHNTVFAFATNQYKKSAYLKSPVEH